MLLMFLANKIVYNQKCPTCLSQKSDDACEELFVSPRHGVAIKGGADLTLTGSLGFEEVIG